MEKSRQGCSQCKLDCLGAVEAHYLEGFDIAYSKRLKSTSKGK